MITQKKQYCLYNFLLSKYTYNAVFSYPRIITLTFAVTLYYKQKHKFLIFLHIILLLLFTNPNMKTQFFFKTAPINLVRLQLKGSNAILCFIFNFIYIYFPLIDSFSCELKYNLRYNLIKFCFFKFPLLFELNILFLSLEYLYLFLNNYKFQLEFYLKRKKNYLVNYNFLQFLKFPILLQ